jgi:hypothetical protein
MATLSEHLRSPQFTDTDGQATGSARVAFFVAPGRPRWLGYLFYAGGLVLGLVLALGLVELGDEMGTDLIRIIGVVGVVGAVYGAWEVWRGVPLSLRGVLDAIRRR